MIDDAFVFDCVAHPFNFDPKNAFGNAGLMFNNHLYAFHNALTPDDQEVGQHPQPARRPARRVPDTLRRATGRGREAGAQDVDQLRHVERARRVRRRARVPR